MYNKEVMLFCKLHQFFEKLNIHHLCGLPTRKGLFLFYV